MLLAIVHFYKPSPSEPLPWTLLPAGRSGRQHWDTTAGVSREQLSLMMKAICQIQTSQIQTVLLNFKKKLLPLIGRDEHRNTRHCSILTLQFPAIINRLYINRGTRCEPSVPLVRSNFHSVGKSPLQYSDPNVCFLKTTK